VKIKLNSNESIMRSNSTTIKIPDFIEPIIYPFPMKEEFSSAGYVRSLRSKAWRRYEKEIRSALSNLLKKPKKEWPKLLR